MFHIRELEQKDKNLIPPICDQAHYNLVYREIVDRNYRDLFRFRKYGITAWSPLEGGILTGKYFDNKMPEDSRINKLKGKFPNQWEKIKLIGNLNLFIWKN